MKKSGFTLIEMIIVLALTVIIIGIASSMFTTGNRIFSDSDAKSTLQIQAHAIEEELSKTGMEAVGINSIRDEIGNDYIEDKDDPNNKKYKIVNQKYTSLNLTDINGKDSKKEWLAISELTADCYEEINDNISVSTTPASVILCENEKISIGGTEFQGRVQSVRIKPVDIENSEGTFKNTNAITISITLLESSGVAEVTYPVLVTVKFRNNFMR